MADNATQPERYESATIWRNWRNVAQTYPKSLRLDFYEAILDYAMDGAIPPEPTSNNDKIGNVRYAAYMIAKSGVDKSHVRSKARQGKIKKEQTNNKPTTNAPQGKGQGEGEGEVKVKAQDCDIHSVCAGEPNMEEVLIFAADRVHHPTCEEIPADFAGEWYRLMQMCGWRDSRCQPVTAANWKGKLWFAWKNEKQMSRSKPPRDGVQQEPQILGEVPIVMPSYE